MITMKVNTLLVAGAVSVVFTGCWTVSETEYPVVDVTQAPAGAPIKVRLENYRTGVYNYVPVEGHESMDPESGRTSAEEARRQQADMGDSTVAFGLQGTASGRIVSRSIAELERKGYKIDRTHPDYVISARFTGPEYYDYDMLRQLGYMICTLFTAEKSEVTWRAHLAVYNSDMTKVLHEKDFEQNYQTTVWGPIPIASPACNVKVTEHASSSWALTALSDQVLAEATAFIALRP